MNGLQVNQILPSVPNVNLNSGIKKKCPKCNQTKTIDNFYHNKTRKDGYGALCKECCNEAARQLRKVNPEKAYKAKRKYRKINNEKIKEAYRQWRRANIEKAREIMRQWAKNNPEKIREYQRKSYKKTTNTPKGKLNYLITRQIRRTLRGKKAGRHWEDLVGWNIKQLKNHLEKQFLVGMTWENRNEWHIDHIVPILKFNYEKPEDLDFKRCWALKNLRPLWKIDNLKKGIKIDKPFQPSLIF